MIQSLITYDYNYALHGTNTPMNAP